MRLTERIVGLLLKALEWMGKANVPMPGLPAFGLWNLYWNRSLRSGQDGESGAEPGPGPSGRRGGGLSKRLKQEVLACLELAPGPGDGGEQHAPAAPRDEAVKRG